jgi:hypothetical protein
MTFSSEEKEEPACSLILQTSSMPYHEVGGEMVLRRVNCLSPGFTIFKKVEPFMTIAENSDPT